MTGHHEEVLLGGTKPTNLAEEDTEAFAANPRGFVEHHGQAGFAKDRRPETEQGLLSAKKHLNLG